MQKKKKKTEIAGLLKACKKNPLGFCVPPLSALPHLGTIFPKNSSSNTFGIPAQGSVLKPSPPKNSLLLCGMNSWQAKGVPSSCFLKCLKMRNMLSGSLSSTLNTGRSATLWNASLFLPCGNVCFLMRRWGIEGAGDREIEGERMHKRNEWAVTAVCIPTFWLNLIQETVIQDCIRLISPSPNKALRLTLKIP